MILQDASAEYSLRKRMIDILLRDHPINQPEVLISHAMNR